LEGIWLFSHSQLLENPNFYEGKSFTASPVRARQCGGAIRAEIGGRANGVCQSAMGGPVENAVRAN
jgi:hypothetical protein